MSDLFTQLDDQAFFEKFVTTHFSSAPASAVQDFPCQNTIDLQRVRLAYNQYQQSLETFRVLLDSKNPDHYKRSGALLHALYKNQIITSVVYGNGPYGTFEELEADQPLGLSYSDIQGMIKYAKFYNEFYNQMLSFDLAYSCCYAYEDNPTDYDYNYLHNMCFYLYKNEDLSVDSFAMMFRSLMHGR